MLQQIQSQRLRPRARIARYERNSFSSPSTHATARIPVERERVASFLKPTRPEAFRPCSALRMKRDGDEFGGRGFARNEGLCNSVHHGEDFVVGVKRCCGRKHWTRIHRRDIARAPRRTPAETRCAKHRVVVRMGFLGVRHGVMTAATVGMVRVLRNLNATCDFQSRAGNEIKLSRQLARHGPGGDVCKSRHAHGEHLQSPTEHNSARSEWLAIFVHASILGNRIPRRQAIADFEWTTPASPKPRSKAASGFSTDLHVGSRRRSSF